MTADGRVILSLKLLVFALVLCYTFYTYISLWITSSLQVFHRGDIMYVSSVSGEYLRTEFRRSVCFRED